MKSGKAVCQCPEGETLASDDVTCVGTSVLMTICNRLLLIAVCAVMLSVVFYLHYLQIRMNVQLENMAVSRSV